MRTNEFPKKAVLQKKREFDRVYRSGRRLYGEGFAVIFAPNDYDMNRLGISVPKKVGTAVRRNRIKRLIREVFRTNRDCFPSNADVVITVRPGFAASGSGELLLQMTAAMHRR